MPCSISRRAFTRLLCLSAIPKISGATSDFLEPADGRRAVFQHPGMLHSDADLNRMRDAVKRRVQPIYSGFEKFRDDPHSQLSYRPAGASEEVGRNPTIRASALEGDSNAAYQLALMGHILEDQRYFKLCAAILDDWAATLKRITGADAILCAGLSPFKLVNAAELLRMNGGGWPETSARMFSQFLRGVVLPVIHDFAPFANGNWDGAALKTMMAIAIFTDDVALLDRALVYYMHGCGDGRLEHYIYPTGQCQESGRDEQHTQLGLAHMGDCCEMAWHQGLDLYGGMDNRLLRGFEYTARYEVGNEVPFAPDVDQTGKYRHAVISPRSPLRPVYEQIYNHYAMRRGIVAPWTEKAAAQIRPEGAAFGADHTGFGTLLYSRGAGDPLRDVPSADPSGFFAENVGGGIKLSWVPTVKGGSSAFVRTSIGGRKRLIVSSNAGSLLDREAPASTACKYRLESGNSISASRTINAIAGMPVGWSVGTFGKDVPAGPVFCSGDAWRVTAGAGTAEGIPSGGLIFISHALLPETSFSARLSSIFASQMQCAGIACLREDGAGALLLLSPGNGGISEHISWRVQLWSRPRESAPFTLDQQSQLVDPIVRYGRVYLPLSMRLRHAGESSVAEFRTQASPWNQIGEWKHLPGQMRAGMVVSSGVRGVMTEALWDEAKIGKSSEETTV